MTRYYKLLFSPYLERFKETEKKMQRKKIVRNTQIALFIEANKFLRQVLSVYSTNDEIKAKTSDDKVINVQENFKLACGVLSIVLSH